MADRPAPILPVALIREVEAYVTDQHDLARKYDNTEVLDSSGVYSLHVLAARIYAAGWDDGERAADEKTRAQRMRARDQETTDART